MYTVYVDGLLLGSGLSYEEATALAGDDGTIKEEV